MKSNIYKKTGLIVSCIILVLGVLLVIFGIFKYREVKSIKVDAKSLFEIRNNKTKGDKVYLDIISIQRFGKMSDESTYYYVAFDINEYPFIVKLKENTYNKMVKEFELEKDNQEYGGYHIEGYVDDLEYELQKLLREMINNDQIAYLEDLKFGDYYLLFDSYFLNEIRNPNLDKEITIIVLGSTIIFIAGIAFISALVINKRIKKQLELYPDALIELESGMNKTYGKIKIYLTEKYVISKDNIVPISEISEVYKIDYRYNGIKSAEILGIRLKDNKEIRMGMVPRKYWNNLTELIVDISIKIKK